MPDRAVIFDLDGTLVDTAPDLMRATNHVLETLDRRTISMAEVRSFVGHGARALLTRGLAATGGLPENYDVEPDYNRFVAFYSQNIAEGSVPFSLSSVALTSTITRISGSPFQQPPSSARCYGGDLAQALLPSVRRNRERHACAFVEQAQAAPRLIPHVWLRVHAGDQGRREPQAVGRRTR